MEKERILGLGQRFVAIGLGVEGFGIAKQNDGAVREMFEQAGWGHFVDVAFEQTQLAAGRDGDFGNGIVGDLGDGIEAAQRLQFVTKEFKADRPRTDERPDIENAAAKGSVAFLGDLRFGFVTAVLEEFGQIERCDFIAFGKTTRAAFEFAGRKSLLENRDDVGDDDREGGRRGERGDRGRAAA